MNKDTPNADPDPETSAGPGPLVSDRVKEAAYAAVGLGVLGVQSLQVRRREVAKQLEPQVREAAGHLKRLASATDEAVNPVFDRIESRLPDATRDLVHTARTAATETRDTILEKATRPR